MNYNNFRKSMTVYTAVDENRLKFLNKKVIEVSHIKGCMAEIGVYKGGSSFVIGSSNPDKILYSCDSFEGLPELTSEDLADGNIAYHKKGDFSDTSFEKVKQFLNPLKNVKVIKGFFPDKDIHKEMYDKTYCFVHIDVDLYKSSKDCLEFFWPRMEIGGIIVTDDRNWVSTPGGTKSINEFFKPEEIFDSGVNSYYMIKK